MFEVQTASPRCKTFRISPNLTSFQESGLLYIRSEQAFER